jgi:hypothetical protein
MIRSEDIPFELMKQNTQVIELLEKILEEQQKQTGYLKSIYNTQ